ncbi:MAG: SDR family oxidoreductase [Gemmatimonadota bacterium]|nr:MAG: SDR family oxidoreductase [Gemmatimonadota bacterium]
MDFGIAEKTALLMSSTRGLGFGCAAALAAEGVRVVINGRNTERGLDAESKLGEKAHFVQADVSRAVERARLFKEARARLGTISILVTNIDGPPPGTFMSKSKKDWRAAFELVMLSALDLVQRCLPDMIEEGYGRIVNISSISAKEITTGTPLSNGIKPGLLGALGTRAREVGAAGVTVNSILPGPFDTDLLRRFAPHVIGRGDLPPDEAVQRYAERGPMKRLGTIEEFGALCAFLCSRQAGYITGQSIVIDGGHVPALL